MRTILPLLALIACGGGTDDTDIAPTCTDGDTQLSDTSCGLNDRGRVAQECIAGAWEDGDCDDSDECTDGESSSESCWEGKGAIALSCADGLMAPVSDCTLDAPAVVSVHSDGTLGDANSDSIAVSADGRWVAFTSYATNLVDGDTNARRDVFLHDLETSTTTLVSQATDGSRGTLDSWSPAISGDGRLVAFVSQSSFDSGDTGTADIYLRDTVSGTTTWLSQNAAGEGGDRDDFAVDISTDGEVVVFASNSTNLVSGDDNANTDLFFWQQGEGLERFAMANGAYASDPIVNADGSYVAFISDAASVVARGGGPEEDAYLLDVEGGSTVLMSRDSTGADSLSYSLPYGISDNGEFVAFWTRSPLTADDANGSDDVFVYDRLADANTRVSNDYEGNQTARGANYPKLSADGGTFVFQSSGAFADVDSSGQTHVFISEISTGSVKVASVNGDGALADVGAVQADLSGDARHIAFVSGSTNMDPRDTAGVRHIYVVPAP